MATRAAETNNGVTTSWVPLTTPGPTLSPECTSAIYLSPQNNASIGAYDPWYGQNVNTNLRCQLPQQTTWWDQSNLAASTLWNLGPLACPNGYTTASTASVNPISTILACCPSGYDYQDTIAPAPEANECFSTLTSGQVITPLSSSAGTWRPTTMTITGTGSVIHGVQINGWNFASSSTSSGAAQTSGSAASSTSGSAAANTTGGSALNATSGSSGGLSSGAKAGIGIAVTLGVIGICCLVATFMFFRRRRHAHGKEQENFVTPPDYYAQAPAAPYGEGPKVGEYSYPGAQPTQQYVAPVEISGHSKPAPPVEIG
ncbi:hypothetical protein N431DRAFT_492375 [Stipitochalara longipes BDJ]|nr:hypothetical protein N431DRAFT_492375 [Stipitochalara longipes BDJ]